MKNILGLTALALVLVQGAAVRAQTAGEADPSGARAAAVKPATAAEKAAAKAARKAEGAAAAKAAGADDSPNVMGAAKSATKEERAAAAKKRRADATLAQKKGEIPSGEK